MIVETFKTYDNLNFLIWRNKEQKYSEVGRNQTLDAAIEKDIEIQNILRGNFIEYGGIINSLNIVDELLIYIRRKINQK